MTNDELAHGAARLMAKVVKDASGCWLWTGRIKSKGYGDMWIAGATRHVHRIAYEHFVGPIPAGLFVCHKCDVRNCVNPAHLFVGTHTDNQQDMVRKGRHTNQSKTHCPQGHPYSGDNLQRINGRGRTCRTCAYARRRAIYVLNKEKENAKRRTLHAQNRDKDNAARKMRHQRAKAETSASGADEP